ncbi:hypothetical protein GTY54_49740 [Streptomyces sp. SID625]|nr:hypothetical protein [Streptomyces sp. SID625]MYR63959.1 hypothetical protein [Streptomyces sp. SID625]
MPLQDGLAQECSVYADKIGPVLLSRIDIGGLVDHDATVQPVALHAEEVRPGEEGSDPGVHARSLLCAVRVPWAYRPAGMGASGLEQGMFTSSREIDRFGDAAMTGRDRIRVRETRRKSAVARP